MALALEFHRSEREVSVGWFESVFNHKDADGRRSGYSYDYQLRIAANSGWKYDYVEGSWDNLYKQLLAGKIDLLSKVAYTEENKDKLFFSKLPMGVQNVYLIVLASSSDIIVGEPSTLKGKRIGVQKESIQLQQLKQWQAMSGAEIKICEYDMPEEKYLDILESGEVDGVAVFPTFNKAAVNSCIPVQHLGFVSYYFAVNKNKPELIAELDKAMAKICSHNPYYNTELNEKYLTSSGMYRFIPYVEADWIEARGVIRIGYRDNYMPYCGTDPETGKVTGLLKDFIDNVNSQFENLDIYLEAVPYPTINAAMAAVQAGEVDAAFPSGIGNYDAEQMNLLLLERFVTSSEMAVVRKNDYFSTERPMRAAINSSNPNYLSLIYEQYPNWQIVHFPSTDECLKGVSEGKADLLLISNYRLSELDERINDLNLKAVATGSEVYLTFVVDKGESLLYSIMNRFTRSYPHAKIQASLAKYSEVVRHTSFSDILREHIGSTLLTILIFFVIIVFFWIRSSKEHRRAQIANLAKTRFLFNLSHDIRTPMNAIIGYTDLMQKSIDDSEKCRDYVHKIASAGHFLLGLINNVLELARIESGKVEVKEEPIIAHDVLNELNELYAELFAKKGVSFEMKTSSEVDVKAIYCDKIKIEEIYLNMLSNALKYTPSGGKVTVTAKAMKGSREGYVKIVAMVSDTGIGMSKEYLPHVFEDFTREKVYADSKVTGTGLGMAIVKKLVEMMGGTITVVSELGKGTTFTLTLEHRIADEKMIEQQKAEEKKQSEDELDFTGRRILLAEDNDLNAEIAIEILSEVGFKVERAANGQDCISMLNAAADGYYDLILMDIQMPVMNGYEATINIRALDDKAKAQIPIVALTANAFEDDKKNAFDAGMNAHLGKPIEVPKLMAVLADIFKKK